MKKLFLLSLCAISALLVSCNREALVNELTASDAQVFPLRFATAFEEVKAQITDQNLIWQEGDAIAVWDGISFKKFTLASGAGTADAEFEGEAAKADSYTLVYPYSETLLFSEGKVIAEMPSVQTVAAIGGSPREALLCIGTSDNSSKVTLKNAFSLVKVTVPAGVSSIAFEGNVSAKGKIVDALAGKAAIDPATGVSTAVDSVSTVVVNVPAEGGDVIFATLPSKMQSGFKLSLRKEGEQCDAILTVSKDSYALERNAGIQIKNLPAPVYDKFFVRDAADFKKIAATEALQACPVTLGADIDFGGETIKAIPSMSGNFDGQGHKLYNVKVSETGKFSGIFAVTTGIVRNLVVGTEDGESWDGVSEFSIAWDGSAAVDSDAYAGLGVIGRAQNNVYSIINFAKLTSTSAEQTGLGGIVGSFYSGKTGYVIDDCHSYNVIDYNLSSTSQIGGIIGRSFGAGTATSVAVPSNDEDFWLRVTGCTSSSTLKNNDSYARGVAGIVGAIWKVSILLSNVTFDGSITSTYTNDSNFRSGGMFGYINGTSSFKVRNATYAGSIDIATSYTAGCVSGANTALTCYIENFYTTKNCSIKTGIAGNCAMITGAPKFTGGLRVNGGALAGTIQTGENPAVVLDAYNYAGYIQTGTLISKEDCATIKFNGETPPAPPVVTVKDTIAYWVFHADLLSGYVGTWAKGQTAAGNKNVTWSKEAGERGYVNANGKVGDKKDTPTHGKLSYVQVDKTEIATSKGGGFYLFSPANPAFFGEWEGDYLLFEANGETAIPAGAQVHFRAYLHPGNTGMKHYLVEYLDADDNWTVPASLPIKEESGVTYNVALQKGTFCPLEFTETLAKGRTDFTVRVKCCSKKTVENKTLENPDEGANTRIPGVLGDASKEGYLPLIEVITQK